ncbi:putative T complex chaperonin [Toxoplasma gondii GAB2-2007-GAL-DOM2]|uniref:CCT-theta n=14 Tax=Toxoplasma gondii TaxID=5811 RepID=A0A125YSE3_TOXGV|nr:putative T complex chaperonin [Toxoplasma gondii GT1]ESS30831.1 putative T complex chaperonin [Toxoplasma gondii VEG]KAF4643654.1 putative T complex chaperonin [Toxoplasma gondii]KFG29425.1 putative T complex chaperonin [Toxoplasma gondii GAB2-2007-GAL-DOM2]KFG44091.1 putative T complex chaperonin [Toxoplasma gondii p89]KFG55001.1 putative T complex chaperonin [Toxoplasma gondii FOU]KFH00863.1 putative T complex chaperonin [Toxoplasma gondii MAS]KYF43607.1 putative T complex chaperonin [T
MFANRYGLSGLLKEGHRSFTGIDEVTAKNIDACKALTDLTRTSLGPNSLSKLVVTSLGKRIVTAHTSLIVKELEVQHPAAKMLAMAAEMQQQEFGGAVNLLLVFAGQLLAQAEYLLKQGLHPNDVARGYEMAVAKLPAFLEESVCYTLKSLNDEQALAEVLESTVATKPLCTEGRLHKLVAQAAAMVMPPNNPKDFDVENIRVAKLTGGRLSQSVVLKGMVVTRPPSGSVESKQNCKVMVLGCGLECSTTEAKGTVLVHNAEELKNFTKGEERQMEEIIKGIKDAGVEVIIVHGGAISDVAQHFCNKYDILTLKIQSKFETRRLCRALGATAVVRLGVPTPEELGSCLSITVSEISSKKVTNILTKDSRVCTVVLRGSTPSVLDEAERAIDDAANLVKALTQDPRLVAGAGATEMEMSRKFAAFGATLPGVEQYAVLKFGEAFEMIPRLLAESSGHSGTEALAALHAAHGQGRVHEGVNTDISVSYPSFKSAAAASAPSLTINAVEKKIYDHHKMKQWALRLGADAALTVLRVDQIIMARPAGGPAPRAPGAPDLD